MKRKILLRKLFWFMKRAKLIKTRNENKHQRMRSGRDNLENRYQVKSSLWTVLDEGKILVRNVIC